MANRSTLSTRLAILGAGALLLTGCDTVRDAAGLSKQSPDEFAVATKAPLIIPPEFNLHPPRDGAPPTNQVGPTDAAQTALFPTDPTAQAASIKGEYSPAERQLLVQANAANADPGIRQQIATDGKAMEASNDSFTNQVLFWQEPKGGGTNVDADAEARRVAAQKAAGAPVTPAPGTTASTATSPLTAGTGPAPAPNTTAPVVPAPADEDKKPADSATIKKDDSGGGWLDGIF